MWNRNIGKCYIIERIMNRMFKCLNSLPRRWGVDDEKQHIAPS